MPEIQDTVAVVTGCTSGIGKSLALSLAARGVTVIATARRVESLADLVKENDNIIPMALELGDLEKLESFRDAVAEKTGGRVDILVNNAGTHYGATALDLEIEEVQKLFNINMFSVMRLCQLFFPLLRKSSHGRIVQIGSVTRDVPLIWQCAYNASKAALSQYTRTLKLELKPFGIEVTEIVTAYVKTNILHHGFYAPEDSLYLPILKHMQRLQYGGVKRGTDPDVYAEQVVTQILAKRLAAEAWYGYLSRQLRFIVQAWPLWLSNRYFYAAFNLGKLEKVA